MRRSVCFTEPTTVLAGERGTWKFVLTTTTSLPKGTLIKFDLDSRGRVIDWQIPEIESKNQTNLIWAAVEGGTPIRPKLVRLPKAIVPQFEFVLPKDVPAGKKITIFLGTPNEKSSSTKGNLSQLTVQRRRLFYVYIDPTGKGHYGEPETFSLDVKGNVLHNIRILVPSIAIKNKRFDVVLRFEDCHGNLTNNAPDDTMIEVSHDNLRESLKWRLFLPETGFIALPNLYFNEPGVYTIHLKNLKTKEEFTSAPIRCLPSEAKHIFWGTLHGESERFDSGENIENCLRHFRDEKSLNFFGSSVPDTSEETSNETWKKISTQVTEFDEDDRFAAFLGQQYLGEPSTEGLRIFIYNKDERSIIRKKEAKTANLKKTYKTFSPKEMISIPSFSMASSTPFSFDEFSPEFERVVEIYNAWGCSERTTKEGNSFPICADSKKGVKENAEGSLLKALMKNRRFGFVAGGLDDRSVFAPLFDAEQKQYSPGLTAVLCDRLTRQNIFDALYNRQCYATTGDRIVIGFTLAGSPMGSELSTTQKPGLYVNRHISGYVAGTAPLKKVELIRNGVVIKTFHSSANALDFEYDDMDDLSKTLLKGGDPKALGFVFYYLRVTQGNGHMAWASPIWIDCMPKPPKKPAQKPPATAPKKALPAFDDDMDEEDEDDDEDLE